jgi:hypothetical protein
MKRVLIRPTFQDWCGNRLFTHGTSWQGLYRSAFSAWKEKALALEIQLDTWDQAPVETCDLLWLLDLGSDALPAWTDFTCSNILLRRCIRR